MAQLSKRTDVNWCMQLVFSVLGVSFIGLGSWVDNYWYLGFGLLFVVVAIVHGTAWRRKKEAFERGRNGSEGNAVA